MGGIFSGRKPAEKTKPFPEQFISLDIRELQREQLLEPEQAYNLHQYKSGYKLGIFSVCTHRDCLELSFTACSQHYDSYMAQSIDIAWTPCHFGGHRPWFLCPSKQCNKRVAILYGPQPMLCRHCRRIAYESQRENNIQRMLRKLRSIEASCPRPQDKSAPNTLMRPKGMHYRTFQQLQSRHQRLVSDISLAQVIEIEKMDESLPDWF